MTDQDVSNETVDPATRSKVLDVAGHRCKWCGREGPGAGGEATLHVHHATRDVDEMDEHDLKNLTAVCRKCHNWLHNQPSEDDAPVELTDADGQVLLPQDVEILQVLARHGPLSTGDIAEQLTPDLTVSSVRERLWVLMGLDNAIPSRTKQIVDQSAETGQWGLVGQISTSARGRIPDDPQTLLHRAEDERVRQALNRGCDRDAVADVIGVVERTTWNKEKRAKAYAFPLDALDSRGGRPPDDADAGDSATDVPGADGDADAETQQRLDAVEGEGESGVLSDGGEADQESTEEDGEDISWSEAKTQLQQTIEALEELEKAL
ncbi:HNH endonuclease [Halomicroarcula sp. S1AR25-4]|uniref:HNH endonuclease n=1 Tax=Haloarcula sp. S1AR25-4 TaxID=2950538 RepID=UPI0028746C42|nr:HNH endonuclease signature motif containing protein [Halomicroarcula sp. S1AR25-4]MDS0276579.1 HNH endonuclease [Halomicroarcula sp. S1AR25-4]